MSDRLDEAQIQAALASCAAEPVHIPGAIQPHGAMVAVGSTSQEILYASQNTEDLLGCKLQELLGKTLDQVFDRTTNHSLLNGMLREEIGQFTNDLGVVVIGDAVLAVTSCASGDCTIFEFEPASEVPPPDARTVRDLEFLLAQTRSATTTQELFTNSTMLLQMLTGYDRVMVYQFDAEGNGQVKGEALVTGLEPYLGLNYPAWDIPAQARRIMLKTPMRYIADVDAQPVPIQAIEANLPDLDMTYAHLRGGSKIHFEYLRNMGTRATLTLNIKLHDDLWGMISFHHASSRIPDQRTRQLCRTFAEVFALQVDLLRQKFHHQQLAQADDLRRRISEKSTEISSDKLFEEALLKELQIAMGADGAALLHKNFLLQSGDVPPKGSLLEILTTEGFDVGVVATSKLAKELPALSEASGPKFAGLLLSRLSNDCAFVFFRKDRATTVTWAGRPEKEIVVENGQARLHPRGSFAAFVQKVQGTAEPWSIEQRKLAEDLWSMFVSAEREQLIKQANRQQSIMIDELNHRVRNILALIRSLSHQSLEHNGSIESYVRALEARIAAVAAAHDLGVDKSSNVASIKQILRIEATPYCQEAKRFTIEGDDIGIKSDLAPMFALAVHELTTNAAKYGSLSKSGGEVRVQLVKVPGGFEIFWQEIGGPVVTPPRNKGFGTTLIEKTIPFEMNGTVEVNFKPSGVCALIQLPENVLLEAASVPAVTVDMEPLHGAGAAIPPEVFTHKCLLVEDNYVVSLDTSRVLKLAGFTTVETALNAKDALEKLDRLAPGIAVLDINLSSGRTSEVVARELKARSIPFLFVTGYGDTQKLDPEFEGTPVLKKPLNEADLRIALVDLIL
ncbi:HWE histidine kinase domain-containing protein [uncultured Roseobacter sp.]|uniref:HWE histidine kinase domain-containing protein n=1 Tax=uncultured Roseobacter sp. TaxID=114847 RepID=UPI0026183D44|nr:HWE histidine kinase domain-containing protein [uncultured Roseobacter sp.]